MRNLSSAGVVSKLINELIGEEGGVKKRVGEPGLLGLGIGVSFMVVPATCI